MRAGPAAYAGRVSKPLFEILDYVDTPIGALCLRRRELLGRPGVIVHEVTLEHEMLMSSLNTASEEALARLAVERHGGQGLSVLVGGLGLGYTAAAALASPRVARVRVVELLPEVIGWLRDGKVPLSPTLAADPRLEVVQGDVYGQLLGPPVQGQAPWDLVLIDVDHSPDERLDASSRSFYTSAGLRRVAAHVAPGGLLGVWSAGDDDPGFAGALGQVFADVTRDRVRFTDERIDEGQELEDVLFFARRPRPGQ